MDGSFSLDIEIVSVSLVALQLDVILQIHLFLYCGDLRMSADGWSLPALSSSNFYTRLLVLGKFHHYGDSAMYV